MPQTLGAFLAMMVVMMFAINFQQSALRSQQRMLSAEVDVMANAVASEAMQYVASKPFDAAISSGAMTASTANLSTLTPTSAFGGSLAYADAIDVDDFNGIAHSVDYEAFPFDVTFEVRYVNDSGQSSLVPTWTKEVTVQVSGPEIMISPIRLTRQFSPLWY